MPTITIGVDLGGSRIKAVAIDKLGNIVYRQYLPTNDGDDAVWKNAVHSAVQDVKTKLHCTYQLLEAFRNGDSFAKEIWLTSVKKLAIGLASITNILSPEMIIIGGGIAEAGNDLFEPLENFMDKYEWRAGGNQTEIVKAQYGDFSGAVGAACFAREQKRK
ncbi:MAG: ROK family protein [Bacteroidota bacterium]|nr:ROK family protein [Bacteroidota bacterium]